MKTKYTHASDDGGSFFLKAKVRTIVGLGRRKWDRRQRRKGREEEAEYLVDIFSFIFFP